MSDKKINFWMSVLGWAFVCVAIAVPAWPVLLYLSSIVTFEVATFFILPVFLIVAGLGLLLWAKARG